MMKITLQTFGGLAAAMRRPPQVVEAEKLAPGEAEELSRLVAAAASQTRGEPKARPDAMSYAIEVEDDGGTTVIRRGDTDMTPEFAKLLEWLAKHR